MYFLAAGSVTLPNHCIASFKFPNYLDALAPDLVDAKRKEPGSIDCEIV
jgi:hypothetical protein